MDKVQFGGLEVPFKCWVLEPKSEELLLSGISETGEKQLTNKKSYKKLSIPAVEQGEVVVQPDGR